APGYGNTLLLTRDGALFVNRRLAEHCPVAGLHISDSSPDCGTAHQTHASVEYLRTHAGLGQDCSSQGSTDCNFMSQLTIEITDERQAPMSKCRNEVTAAHSVHCPVSRSRLATTRSRSSPRHQP